MFGVEACDETPEISADELAQRLLRHFPSAMIDRERGNTHVRQGLDQLIGLGAPDVILKSHQSYFGNVVFASVSETHWNGATATSYLHRMWPPLGCRVLFNVEGADDTVAGAIVNELAVAMGMIPCSQEVSQF